MDRNDIIAGVLSVIIGFLVGMYVNVLNRMGFIVIIVIIVVFYLIIRVILDKILPQEVQ